jgi:hypothetical protein
MGIKQNAYSYFGQLNTKKILLAFVVSIIAFLFTPGFILNLPPIGPPNDDVKEIPSLFFSFKTNIYSMLVHSVVIGVLFYAFISIKFLYNALGIQSIV